MNRLKSFQASEFPLGQSLFWWQSEPFGNNNDNNDAQSTWNWLARDMTDAKRQKMYARLQMYKDMSNRPSWTMVFMVFNMVAKENMVNPFLGCPNAAQIVASGGGQPDNAELEKWKHLLELGKTPGINLIPCLYCGDDAATLQNTAFINYFTPLAVQFLAPYSKAICICSEPPKSINKAGQELIINLCKTTLAFMGRSDIPVVTHLQGDQIKTDLPSNADAVLYQFKSNPWNAHDRSAEDVKAEGAWALRACPVPLGFFELGVYNESDRIREQTRALASLPGCGMLPGPL
jgi:hypothetical protein